MNDSLSQNNESKFLKHEAFVSSNSSARSSNINTRLLKYFEDSLQKEIPISMSPSILQNELNESSQIKCGSKSQSTLFPTDEPEKQPLNKESPKSISDLEEESKDACKSEDNISNYS